MEEIKNPEVDLLKPLQKIDNLLLITKGGAQPILLDKYDEYLNLPNKIVKMTDLVNYLDIFEKYHSQFPSQKTVLNNYLKINNIILGFGDYSSDFGTSDLETYFINSNTGKVKITLKEYVKYLFIMNPQYMIIPFEYLPFDAGKKRITRFLNKLNIVFENLQKEKNFKELNCIIPYYLEHSKFLEENKNYKSNMTKCKGVLIFTNDDYKNINYDKIIKYKDQIEKMIKDNFNNEKIMIIKSSMENIVDLIVGALIGCSHYEISFPYIYAQEGKCLNILFEEYLPNKDYGKIKDINNFNYQPNLLDLNDIKYSKEIVDITKGCKCFSCLTGYKRSYLYHLFKCKELNGPIIVTIHNYFQVRELYNKLNELKDDIDKLNNFVMWFLNTQCIYINK